MRDEKPSPKVEAIRDFMADLFPSQEVLVAENPEMGCVDFSLRIGHARVRLKVPDEVLSDVPWENLKGVFQRDNLKEWLSQAKGQDVVVTSTGTGARLSFR